MSRISQQFRRRMSKRLRQNFPLYILEKLSILIDTGNRSAQDAALAAKSGKYSGETSGFCDDSTAG